MTWTKAQLPRPATDFILVGEVGLAALCSEVALIEDGEVREFFPIPAERFVRGPGDQVLVLSERDEEHLRTVHSLRVLSSEYTLLGQLKFDHWLDEHDDDTWVATVGDTIRIYSWASGHLEVVYEHLSFFPVRLERVPEGLFVEASSLGAHHYELRSYPQLDLLEGGNFPHITGLDFGQEMGWYSIFALPPGLSICAIGPAPGRSGGNNRLVDLTGTNYCKLAAPPAGLDREGNQALVWSANGDGMEFCRVDLETAAVDRLLLLDVKSACARLHNGETLIADSRGRLLRAK